MPSLKVARLALMNARWSILRYSWKLCAVGTEDSPTPIVPISSLSTSVTCTRLPSWRASAVAVIHPAVPPPATTTLTGTSALIVEVSGLSARCGGAGRRRPAVLFEELLVRRQPLDAGGNPRADFAERLPEPLVAHQRGDPVLVFCCVLLFL